MKMFKFLFIMLIAIIMPFSLFLTGCGNNNGNNDNNNNNSENETLSIELTMDNYEYYLSIDKVLTDSRTLAGGSIRLYFYKVTIYGAINGLYYECSLFYKIGDDGAEREVKLNATGFATFNYSQKLSEAFSFVRATGEVII